MKEKFINALHKRLYLDGGMGSSLIRRGMDTSNTELLNITHSKDIIDIHKSFLASGSNIIYTNTFNCNRKKANLQNYSLSEIIFKAVENAKDGAKNSESYILYDCGPIGELLYPYGKMTFDEAYDIFAEQAEIIKNFDIDGVVIETMSDLQEMRASILAFSELTNFPIIASMTFEENGRTFAGTSVESFALCAQALGVSAIGANCGTGAKGMINTAKALYNCAKVPVFIKPNAGIPRYENGKTKYDTTVEEFVSAMKEIAFMGIGILGGCCGTNEEHIRETIKATKDIAVRINNAMVDGVCSYSKVVSFKKDKTVVIGERVNPTNKPLLKQAIIEDNFDYILSMCIEQAEQGADILDINLGMAEIDEPEKLKSAISYIQGVADLPLCVDTSKKQALDSAVRITNGVCIINSVNGEKKTEEKVFPIAKKYGSYIIALCMDEKGIPNDVDGRLNIAKGIINEAEKYGISKDKLIFDPLTMAVSVGKDNGIIVLETIRRLRNELKVKTTLGLSNISFGLPNRDLINGTFYKMVKEQGVSSVIINPSLNKCDDVATKVLLLGKDDGCVAYLAQNAGKKKTEENTVVRDIKYCIRHGIAEEAVRAVKAIANENTYSQIIETDIIGALNELGDDYENGKAFLPQLIAGSESAKCALEYIKGTFMAKGTIGNKATILLATVKGDVHDIGKNIVKAVISNYGYRIIDLGKDVSTEIILDAIIKYQPQAIGLSALMTTTVDNMTETVSDIKSKYPELPILVGGAIVTSTYAGKIGAIYSSDAQNTVKILEKMFSNR